MPGDAFVSTARARQVGDDDVAERPGMPVAAPHGVRPPVRQVIREVAIVHCPIRNSRSSSRTYAADCRSVRGCAVGADRRQARLRDQRPGRVGQDAGDDRSRPGLGRGRTDDARRTSYGRSCRRWPRARRSHRSGFGTEPALSAARAAGPWVCLSAPSPADPGGLSSISGDAPPSLPAEPTRWRVRAPASRIAPPRIGPAGEVGRAEVTNLATEALGRGPCSNANQCPHLCCDVRH